MPANRTVHEDAVLHVATRRNVTVAVWKGTPGVQHIHAFHRASEQLATSGGERLLVSVVLRGVPKFSDGVRDELVRVMKNHQLFPLGTAHVVLLPGLAGAAVRAFLSTVRLLARRTTPAGVFGTAEEAVGWASERLRASSERWTVNELREVVEEATQGR